MTPHPATLSAAFQANVRRSPDSPAVRSFDGSVELTWREYDARVRRVAAALAAAGVGHGDTVGIMLTNRPEFHLCDTAALHLGAAPFSVYNTSAPEQLAHVLGNAANNMLFCEEQFVEKLHKAIPQSAVQHLVCVDAAPEGTVSLAEFEAGGAADFDFDAAWQAVRPEDVATIIYTSGTTGPPKGVEQTHGAVLMAVDALIADVSVTEKDLVISYLPDAHGLNRLLCHYMNAVKGIQVVTVADPKLIVDALTQLRPTIFAAVPAIWYKVKAKLEAALAAEHGAKKSLATWAISTGVHVARLTSDGKDVPLPLRVQHAVADRVILRRLRGALGMDRVRLAFSGAAPIAPEAMEFVFGLGLPVCEGWGISECGVGTVNPLRAPRIGTVGKPVRGIDLQLADDGEILIRGPQLMRGYRDDPVKTAEAIDPDGWMHTGDIGSFDDDGYLRIVDRKKELIINAAGKNMSPANIENTVKVACPLIGSVVALGDRRKYVVALITLDPDAAVGYAMSKGLADAFPADLVCDPGLLAEIEAGVKAANERLARAEQIKKFTVLPAFWEPGGEELTPTMKLKRKVIAKKYEAEIETLYT